MYKYDIFKFADSAIELRC